MKISSMVLKAMSLVAGTANTKYGPSCVRLMWMAGGVVELASTNGRALVIAKMTGMDFRYEYVGKTFIVSTGSIDNIKTKGKNQDLEIEMSETESGFRSLSIRILSTGALVVLDELSTHFPPVDSIIPHDTKLVETQANASADQLATALLCLTKLAKCGGANCNHDQVSVRSDGRVVWLHGRWDQIEALAIVAQTRLPVAEVTIQ